MLKSAEYFLAGFFGLQWQNNASLEVIIENNDGIWNNTLAGYDNCNNSNTGVSAGGSNASLIWENIYLQNATQRLKALSGGFNWTLADSYNAQSLCAYETVAFGYSAFCDLFTYQEWQGYEYSVDLSFYGSDSFGSPTGRGVGIGYQQEILAVGLLLRVSAIVNGSSLIIPSASSTSLNNECGCSNQCMFAMLETWIAFADSKQTTLDGMTSTFPLNQSLYFDFSHDTNIMSILTAFGLTQFAQFLPTTGPPPNQQLIVSHLEPFGARVDIEIISAPQPVSATRTESNSDCYVAGPPTKYVHFLISQRTVPLGVSFPSCGNRKDGWCELTEFINVQSTQLATAQYDYSCNGNYPPAAYGAIRNGVPLPAAS